MATADPFGVSCSTRPSSPEATVPDTVPPYSPGVPAGYREEIGGQGRPAVRTSTYRPLGESTTTSSSSAGSCQAATQRPSVVPFKCCPTCGRNGPADFNPYFSAPGYSGRPLAYDSPNEVLDSISIPVAEGSEDGRSEVVRNPPPAPATGWRNALELGLTFVIVVSLWGAIDVCAELLSFDVLAMELVSYGVFVLLALIIIICCNQFFNSKMSIAGGLSRF